MGHLGAKQGGSRPCRRGLEMIAVSVVAFVCNPYIWRLCMQGQILFFCLEIYEGLKSAGEATGPS